MTIIAVFCIFMLEKVPFISNEYKMAIKTYLSFLSYFNIKNKTKMYKNQCFSF